MPVKKGPPRVGFLKRPLGVGDVMAAMNAWAPPELAYDWDRSGLATGTPYMDVTGVVTCLTPTQTVLAAAKKAKANLIVSHHPLIWEPLKSLCTDDAPAKLALDIASANIACYSAHTNLDVVPQGVNHVLAERLGLINPCTMFPAPQAKLVKLVTFVPDSHLAAVRDAVSEAGAGEIGNYTHCSFSAPGKGTFKPSDAANPHSGKRGVVNEEPEQRFEIIVPHARLKKVELALLSSHPYEQAAWDIIPLENEDTSVGLGLIGRLPRVITLQTFAKRVREALEISHLRFSGDPKMKVLQVAVMGGAGGGSAPKVPAFVNAFVTGDVKYHEAVDAAERGLGVIDAGHHGTEKWIVPAMTEYLKKQFKGLRVRSYMEPDPFRAITG